MHTHIMHHPQACHPPASTSPPIGTSRPELSERRGADGPAAGDRTPSLAGLAGPGVVGEPGKLVPLLPCSSAREMEKLGNLYSLMSRSTTWVMHRGGGKQGGYVDVGRRGFEC